MSFVKPCINFQATLRVVLYYARAKGVNKQARERWGGRFFFASKELVCNGCVIVVVLAKEPFFTYTLPINNCVKNISSPRLDAIN